MQVHSKIMILLIEYNTFTKPLLTFQYLCYSYQ